MQTNYVISASQWEAKISGALLAALYPSPNSRPRNDFQFDEPLSNSVPEIVFRASRGLKAADIRKVDRAVGLHARGRIQLWMVDDPDGDNVRSS
jgi:hypothetical protein